MHYLDRMASEAYLVPWGFYPGWDWQTSNTNSQAETSRSLTAFGPGGPYCMASAEFDVVRDALHYANEFGSP